MRHFTLISVWLLGKLTNMNNANILGVQHPAKIYIKQFSATPSCQRNSAQGQKKKIFTLYAVTIPRSTVYIIINQSNYFFFWIFYNYFSAIFGSKEYIRKRLVLGGCSHSWLAISRLPVNYRLTRRRASPGQNRAHFVSSIKLKLCLARGCCCQGLDQVG